MQKVQQTLRGTLPQALYISFFSLILPQILFEVYFGRQVAASLKRVETLLAGYGAKSPDFLDLMIEASNVISLFLAVAVPLGLLYLSAFFALIHLSVQFNQGKMLSRPGAAFLAGIRLVMPHGLLGVIFLALLFALSQIMFPPLVILLLPALMFPVFLAQEKTTVFSAMRSSLSIRFGSKFPGGRLALFFQTVSIGAFMYAALLLVSFLSRSSLSLDQFIAFPRGWMIEPFLGLPFSMAYFVQSILRTVLLVFVMMVFSAASCSLYFWAQAFASPIPPQGIEV